MSRAITARGRAARFNDVVEGAPMTAADERLTDLLSTVAALRTAEQVVPRAEFSADLRSQLMLAARTELTPAEAAPAETIRKTVAPRSKRERRIAVAIGGFAVVSATTSMAVAAQSALPGDTLYPLKRAIENAHVSVQSSPDDKGGTLIDNASGRLAEVDELTSTGKAPAADVAHTLDDFAEQATAASDLLISDYQNTGDVGSLEELSDFTTRSLSELKLLQDVVPVAARGALIKAAQVLNQIEQLAAQACPSCTLSALTAAPLTITSSIINPLTDVLGVSATDPRDGADGADAKPRKHRTGERAPSGTGTNTGTNTDGDQGDGKKSQQPSATSDGDQTDGETGLIPGIINGLTDPLRGDGGTSGKSDNGDKGGKGGGSGDGTQGSGLLTGGGLGGVLEAGVGAIDGLLGLHD